MSKEEVSEQEKQTAKKGSFFKRHKKLLLSICGILIVLLVALRIALPQIICTSIEKITPMVTGGKASLDDISLSIFSGRVELSGLKIGNPEGFSSEHVLTVGTAVFDIDLGSVFSDKIRIEEITVKKVDLYLEQTLTTNNLATLNKNVQSFAGTDKKKDQPETKTEAKTEAKTETKAEAKKLQIDLLDISDVKVNVVAGSVTTPVPMIPIKMEKLGTGPEGITGANVFAKVMDELILDALKAASAELLKHGQKLLDTGAEAGQKLLDHGAKAGQNLLDHGSKAGQNLLDHGSNLLNGIKDKF